ncbi:endonuclease I family protein [Bacteriovorax sp. Seq25_V]|uniref:endonuclease I family protein n=1 Tax=Bacteriovorax sp. Seq25_V TaxID=1201288 RepID=UPI00038A0D9A|nr:endonuclease [Bacteriovorax sp. Seq25_V]EQC43993.1 nuclease, EndA/NucM family [Bacteriovorax sp. Seq25_V]
MSKLRHLCVYFTFIIASSAFGDLSKNNFYSKDLVEKLEQYSQDGSLKSHLFEAISKDQEVNFDYKRARQYLFGEIDLKRDSSGNYYFEDRYCDMRYGQEVGIGKDKIPNPNILNCEHTWPQSKFNPKFSKNTQKNDLHHLFGVWSNANSSRSNLIFAEVDGRVVSDKCIISKRGTAKNSTEEIKAFEPPVNHRGNVARALFYFSTRYQLEISNAEEYYLRKWDKEDPVDEEEIARNEKIYKIQKNRNPYIDDPYLVDLVKDF